MIKVLKVQNYKSLKNVEIPVRPLTVLVGPNEAGKSNVLDCLELLSSITKAGNNDVSSLFGRRGGFPDIAWGGERALRVSVSYSWETLGPAKERIEHYLSFVDIGGTARACIAEEKISWQREEHPLFTVHRITNPGKNVVITIEPERTRESVDYFFSAFSRPDHSEVLRRVQKMETDWQFYDFVSSVLRQPQRVAKETRLNPDGSNVVTVLHWIYSEERRAFDEVEENLKTAIPEVEELQSKLTEGGQTYVAWKERNIPQRIPAWNMSEGSVRLVAILVALLVPEPPPLVSFETPEIHLHPQQMEYLAEILKNASRRSQVITTHSPYLLNYIDPEDVLVVWKEDGETRVKPAESTKGLKQALKTLGLGELYYAGHLGGGR